MSYIVNMNMSEKCEPGDSQLSSLDCWDYSIELECLRGPEDLQLAAELGKTLLERNKELETSLKQHQNIIEDQTQEIEYLTKQTVALREVNDSRLRIYEQLEVSIHDLERANHRLTLDVAADKKQIKSLCANIDVLESRNEELQGTVDHLTAQTDAYKRKCERIESTENGGNTRTQRNRHTNANDDEANEDTELLHDKQVQCDSTTKPEVRSCNAETSTSPIRSSVISSSTAAAVTVGRKDGTDVCDGLIANNEQILTELRDMQVNSERVQRRIVELEEQLAALVQENQALETQLLNASTRDEAMKSMHDELNTLDEVRQGQLCRRCLRNAEMTDDMSILDTEEEDDDNLSMIDAITSETRYRSSVSLNIEQDTNHPAATQSNNLYRDLVEKYEALLAVNRDHRKPSHPMSLQEELQMSGDFNNLHAKDTDEESGHGCDSMNSYDNNKNTKNNAKNHRKATSQTPTDFSEAETSSSGFADETSNKSTQTDGRPGSFLCTIADGEDCKFSIYDDASPIDSRFRNRPEYRELFKEIFTVLKKAAENKDEGEDLPLLDDCTPITCIIPKVPPVTPATEDFPSDFINDNESVASSAMSDISSHSIEPQTVVENVLPSCKETPNKAKKMEHKKDTTPTAAAITPHAEKKEKDTKVPTLTPYKREPLEYVSVSVNVRKKSSAKKNNKKQFIDRSDSPVLPLSPRISYLSNGGGRKRKEYRTTPVIDNNQVWNGSTLQFWSTNRNISSPTPSQCSNKSSRQEKSSWDFKPSTASQDLNKLKRLDLSYAEVLRNADNTKKRESYGKSGARRK